MATAQINLNSGTQWKVSGTYEPGWLDPSFDDASWVNATSPHNLDVSASVEPGVIESMWIRPYYSSTGTEDSVYCRIAFELRTNCINVAPFSIKADDRWIVLVNGVRIAGGVGSSGGGVAGFNSSAFRIGKNVVCVIGINGKLGGGGIGPHHLSCKGRIDYTSGPVIDLGADKFVCQGDTTLVTVNHNYNRYTWSDGQTERTAKFSLENKYWCTARDTAGCPWVDTVEVIEYPTIPIGLGEDTSICQGDIATFNADPDSVYKMYLWSTGDTTRTTSVGYQDNFFVTVTDQNECEITDSRSVRVFVSGTAVNLGEDTVLCRGDSLQLNAFFPQSKYKWSDGTEDSLFLIKSTGNYEVTVTNFCGTAIDEIAVQFIDEVIVNLGPDDYLCSNNQFELGGVIPAVSTYQWSTGDTTPTITVDEPGVYELDVVDYCGNEGRDEIEIIRELNPELSIPNAFSPNEDALNETWRTFVRTKSYFKLMVIDQWSKVLFETDDPKAEWDGKFEGRPLGVGKYIFTVEWDECLNQPQVIQGTVNIVR